MHAIITFASCWILIQAVMQEQSDNVLKQQNRKVLRIIGATLWTIEMINEELQQKNVIEHVLEKRKTQKTASKGLGSVNVNSGGS